MALDAAYEGEAAVPQIEQVHGDVIAASLIVDAHAVGQRPAGAAGRDGGDVAPTSADRFDQFRVVSEGRCEDHALTSLGGHDLEHLFAPVRALLRHVPGHQLVAQREAFPQRAELER